MEDHQTLKLKIRYFASLRDGAGKSEEWIESTAKTAAGAYAEIKQKYGFVLDSSELRAAVNGSFAEMDSSLKNGDELVFIPPVSGG